MQDQDAVEFTGSVDRRRSARVGLVLGVALLFVVAVVATMAASPSPSTGTPGNGSTETDLGPFDHGRFGGRFGGFGQITITSIRGDQLSLETEDGWTRTITVTDDTTIVKGGQEIGLDDLAVGDPIRFAQERNDDGSYTVTAIKVLLPTVAGEVTAKDADSLTIEQRGGTSITVHVDANTVYRLGDVDDPGLDDIEVGDIVIAQGEQNSDGSLDASIVASGRVRGFGFWGDKRQDRQQNDAEPSASPEGTSG